MLRSFAVEQAQELVSIIWNSKVSAVRGFECIDVYGVQFRRLKLFVMSTVELCLLCGVPLPVKSVINTVEVYSVCLILLFQYFLSGFASRLSLVSPLLGV